MDEQLAAVPPRLPDTPGLFVMPAGNPAARTTARDCAVTDDPEQARRWIGQQPEAWPHWQHVPDVTCLLAAPRWQLWSDGAITRGHWLPGLWFDPPREPSLPEPAAKAVAVIGSATNTTVKAIPRDLRLRLATATGYASTTVTEEERRGFQCGASTALRRHDVALPGGETVTLWEVRAGEGGMYGGEGDYSEASWVYLQRADAEAEYRRQKPQWLNQTSPMPRPR